MCARNQTIVHAWCLMSNHYHLLLETPQGNLVDAMKWFQGTFTQRYNARHKLWGHLFQGRYKAKLIDDEDTSYFRKVSEYIHLNPADAGLVKPGNLAEYPWSSYPLYLRPLTNRPDWLKLTDVLHSCGIPNDSSKSRQAYQAYMNLRHQSVVANSPNADERADWKNMERGWLHGSRDFRDKMIKCLEEQGGVPEEREQKRELGEAAAQKTLEKCLARFGINRKDLLDLPKSDQRKQMIAGLLRYHYPVQAQWVSDQLSMGHFTTISRAMRFYDNAEGKWAREKNKILKFIG
jgi:REP element-mobilizing transposase RayT